MKKKQKKEEKRRRLVQYSVRGNGVRSVYKSVSNIIIMEIIQAQFILRFQTEQILCRLLWTFALFL